jgi:hypothetical protein
MAAKRQKPGGGKRNHTPVKRKAAAPPPLPPGKPQGVDPTTCNRLYSEDEATFLAAVDRYRRERKRVFPTASELLAIAVSLGYRKVAPVEPLPGAKT